MIFRSLLLRVVALLPISLLIAGCTLTPGGTPSTARGLGLHGNVHGGQQPITGAHVYLLAAASTGYGNASVSLLDPTATTYSDSIGGYVPTGLDGSWDISGDYTCTPNTQVYLYVLGGDPGAGVNSASGLMAAVGNCPSTGNFAASVPYIWINEVSTVAAAYAMAPYAVDALHVASSGTPLALVGIANAFANASNLVDLPSGTALGTTPGGNGAVPTTQINLLANVLAACVNSVGPGSANCSTLLGDATSDGTPSGTSPSETATAMLNIVHHPGANMADLFNLPPATAAFAPALATQPNDFTLAVTYTGSGINSPDSVTIDAAGNAWVANAGNASVTLLSSLGVPLPNSPMFHNGLSGPSQIAIDSNGNAWVANSNATAISEFDLNGNVAAGSPFTTSSADAPEAIAVGPTGNIWAASAGNNTVTLLNTSGTPSPSYITGDGLDSPNFIAIDNSGNTWVANQYSNSITVLDHTGAPLATSPIVGSGINGPTAVSIDATGNAWIGNFSSNNISVVDVTGTPVSGSPFSGAGLAGVVAIAFDGGGNAWVANASGTGVSELSSAGAAVTGSPFNTVSSSSFVAVDGSGSVWVPNQSSNSLVQIIGSAIPAVTPLASAVVHNMTGSRP